MRGSVSSEVARPSINKRLAIYCLIPFQIISKNYIIILNKPSEDLNPLRYIFYCIGRDEFNIRDTITLLVGNPEIKAPQANLVADFNKNLVEPWF